VNRADHIREAQRLVEDATGPAAQTMAQRAQAHAAIAAVLPVEFTDAQLALAATKFFRILGDAGNAMPHWPGIDRAREPEIAARLDRDAFQAAFEAAIDGGAC
jgi:hypothetical protein